MDRTGVTIKAGGELTSLLTLGMTEVLKVYNLTTTASAKPPLLELSFKFLLVSKFKATLICN